MHGPAKGLDEIDVSFFFSKKGMVRGHRSHIGRDEEGDEDRIGYGFPHLKQLIHKAEEGQKEVSIRLPPRVSVSKAPIEIGEEGEDQPRLKHQVQGGLSRAFLQVPEEFIPNTGGGAFLNLVAVLNQGPVSLSVDFESGSCGMPDDPDHSNRILSEAFIGIPDGSDDSPLKVCHPADAIDDGKICNIVEKAVDGNVTAKGILLRSPETLFSDNFSVFRFHFLKFKVAAKRRDFNHLSAFKKDMDQPKSAADDPAVLEEIFDLMRVGIGGDVKILWDSSEEEIPDASSHEIG